MYCLTDMLTTMKLDLGILVQGLHYWLNIDWQAD